MSRRADGFAVALILGAFLVLGYLYATRIPPYNAPDEPAHANHARYIARTMSLPELKPGDWDSALLERLKASRFPAGSDVSKIQYESHQPPLYYVLIAPLAGDSVLPMRLGTLAIGFLALVALYLAARALFPSDSTVAVLALALAAFVPMRLATAASVTNDGLAELWLSLGLWQGALAVRHGMSVPRGVALGLFAGLGMLTKLSAWIGGPLAVVALLLAPGQPRPKGRTALALVLTAVVIVAPWILRNATLYGWDDPLALRRHAEVVAGQPRTGTWDAGMLATLFRSFWGQFGWMGVLLDERIYFALAILSAVVGAGLVLWLMPWGGLAADVDRAGRRGLVLAALLVVGVVVGTVLYNLTYLQPQGRYLFPAMAGVALFAAVGLRELIAERQRQAVFIGLTVGLIVLDLIALERFIVPELTR